MGGTPFPIDFAPSLVFTILHALLIPVAIWRFISPQSRNIPMITVTGFCIDRVVMFSLRIHAAHSASARVSNSLVQYMQSAFNITSVTMAADLLVLLRCLLVSATLQNEPPHRIHLLPRVGLQSQATAPSQPETVPTSAIIESRAKERQRYRTICGLVAIFVWVPLVLGIVAGVLYPQAPKGAHQAQLQMRIRDAAGATSLLFVTIIQGLMIYCALAVRGIERRAVWILFCLSTFLSLASVYRVVVMRLQTDSLTSTAPDSLNTVGSKIAFYHESAQTVKTGLWGDHIRPMEKDILKSNESHVRAA
ncbi:hypothetical protein EIP91_011469 [Steccherinum ochraceum]|uniref:G-protein coupled receptors family 1 profile domain-containing protein n=1 Tax=Steccherinum ochraceum TaxID=92696 RepID=A0A4R0R4W5_9APHY|nr:hypothetical protein EIP91_011469 [Steccherinum ochraceum]